MSNNHELLKQKKFRPEQLPPETYKGLGLIAFLDLLGFSAKVNACWDDEPSPIDTLLLLKQQVRSLNPVSIGLARDGSNRDFHYSRLNSLSTVSDSIVLKVDLPQDPGPELPAALMTMVMSAAFVAEFAADAGFGLRGCIEIGNIYWDDDEIVGPAFNTAYYGEARVADTARVILGPSLVGRVASRAIDGLPTRPELLGYKYLCALLHQCDRDNLLCVKGRKGAGYLQKLRALQAEAPDERRRLKFDDAIRFAEAPTQDLGPEAWQAAVGPTRKAFGLDG